MIRILLAAILLWPSTAWSHSWYDRECCNTTDCAPMPVEATSRMIDVGPAGITVTVQKGDHPLFPEAHGVQFFPWDSDRIRESQDDKWHVCIAETPIQGGERKGEHFMFCVYKPPVGI